MNIQGNNKISSHIAPRKKYQAPQPPSGRDLKESQNMEKSSETKAKSFKLLKKLKVKKMFCKINNKISNILRREKDAKFEDNFIDFISDKIEDKEWSTKPQLKEAIMNQSNEEEPKKALDHLMVELLAKLKKIEIRQLESIEDKDTTCRFGFKPIAPPRKKKRTQDLPKIADKSLLTPSAKNSDTEESESGISSLSEDTSDDSLHEYCGTQKYEIFTRSVKSERKTKVRRTFSWVKDRSLLDLYTICPEGADMDCEKVMYSPKKINNRRRLFFP